MISTTDNETNVLLITVERGDDGLYEKGLEAIQTLEDGESIGQPTTITKYAYATTRPCESAGKRQQ